MRKIKTTRFGEIEEDEGKIIRFAAGLPAFEEEKEFIIVPYDEESPYVFLQSVMTPDLAFLMTIPFIFFPDYEFRLEDDVLESLALENQEDLLLYTLLTLPGNDFRGMTANLLAPIVINSRTNEGRQIVLDKSAYKTKHRLFPREEEKKES
ncbi:flagellar assembly protein FliW [Selenomonas sputigena]|uniref:Flagellar assembly factor FliW n=1 Tax=Selenomonas sputigena TaxID=69823 RepID=A0ABV3X3Q2_9FIRM